MIPSKNSPDFEHERLVPHVVACARSQAGELRALTAQIRQNVRRATLAAQAMAECAIQVGADLILAKALVRHGQWASWISENFSLSTRTAQAYISLARLVQSGALKPQHAAKLSVRQALALGRAMRSSDARDDMSATGQALDAWLKATERYECAMKRLCVFLESNTLDEVSKQTIGLRARRTIVEIWPLQQRVKAAR
jgi:hypothetical protein